VKQVFLRHKSGESRPGCRINAQYFSAHFLGVTAVIEIVTVVETDALEGINQAQLYVVGQTASRRTPKLLQQKGHSNNRRARVKGIAVNMNHAGSASWRAWFFEYLYALPHGALVQKREPQGLVAKRKLLLPQPRLNQIIFFRFVSI
jgi:hypothetical protein